MGIKRSGNGRRKIKTDKRKETKKGKTVGQASDPLNGLQIDAVLVNLTILRHI